MKRRKGRVPLRRSTGGEAVGRAARIDLGPLTSSIGYALRRAQLASFKRFGEVFGPTGLTPAQYSVLLVLDLNPGLRQNQVSDALDIKRANFVGLIDGLERRGLAVRRPTTDKRSYALHLTSEGRKLLKSLQKLSAELDARLCAFLSPKEHAVMMAALAAIAATDAPNGTPEA